MVFIRLWLAFHCFSKGIGSIFNGFQKVLARFSMLFKRNWLDFRGFSKGIGSILKAFQKDLARFSKILIIWPRGAKILIIVAPGGPGGESKILLIWPRGAKIFIIVAPGVQNIVAPGGLNIDHCGPGGPGGGENLDILAPGG